VRTPDGLVGRVNQVSLSTSQVVLIGDPNCRVSALVEETSERSTRKTTAGFGVIESGSSSILDPTIVDLTYVDRNSPVKPGQRVVTSGEGLIFPRGIPVGQIADVSSVGYGLYQEARVKLSADIRNLEHVWVMFP